MSALVEAIAGFIGNHVRQEVAQLKSADGELRAVFNGPPLEFLHPAFQIFFTRGGIPAKLANESTVVVPVVLQLDSLPDGQANPAIGASGECDSDHLLDLRNSITCPRYVGMVPPGKQANLSQISTRSDFGLSAHNNSGSASISEWWNDRFIQSLVDGALSRQPSIDDKERSELQTLIRQAVYAANDVDEQDTSRRGSWRVLNRVWSIPITSGGFGHWLSLACGFPSTGDGSIDTSEQEDVLKAISERIGELGVLGAIASCKPNASPLESEALDAFATQLQSRVDAVTVVTRALPYYYGPYTGDAIDSPPRWWLTLTTECWRKLLGQDPPQRGTVSIECVNPLFPPVSGLAVAVKQEARFRVRAPGIANAVITLTRVAPAPQRTWTIAADSDDEIVDDTIPAHHSPVRYVADAIGASGVKKGALRLISLATWGPGILVSSRTARKASPPKSPRGPHGTGKLECALTMLGEGRHYLDLYSAPGCRVAKIAHGTDDAGASNSISDYPVAKVGDGEYGAEIQASSESYYDFTLERDAQTTGARTLRVYLSCDDVAAGVCSSEYERLLQLNRRKGKQGAIPEVQIDRQLRCTYLQAWMLDADEVGRSFFPTVIAPDYLSHWRPRDWSSQKDTILSRGQFLNDPRPRVEDMVPPAKFVEARMAIAARIRGDDQNGLIESARLGEWLVTDTEFAAVVEDYVRSFQEWLDAAPEVAAWCDLTMITRFEADLSTLVQEPHALLVSPLHPVRLAWHCMAQRALFLTYRKAPCPAASVIDPDSVPDSLVLPLRTASGSMKRHSFFSIECTSDYWSILWNSAKLDQLASTAKNPPFDREFGILAGGIANGFSVSQVHRALDDMTEMLEAQPALDVLLTSAAGHNSACNDGLISWCRGRFAESTESDRFYQFAGPRRVHVIDQRRAEVRPQDAEISNLAEDSQGRVNWYVPTPSLLESTKPDIAIIAQLESTNASAEETRLSSAIGAGGLLRTRIRQQLSSANGAFLSETRTGGRGPTSGDGLADKVLAALLRLENLSPQRLAYTFAPSVPTIQTALDAANYVAVSSAAIDPACFLGGWLKDSYLWDYDLPSYSSRSGDNNGYYLLSRIKEVDREALADVLVKLPGCKGLDDSVLERLILEVARRGIPTVRGLSSGHSGASGDLGLFVASRLLQDEFRVASNNSESLLPVWRELGDRSDIALVIPVDPFRGYIEDLTRALAKPKNQRPDLLVAWIRTQGTRIHCKLTPVEVKYRGADDPMAQNARREALGQARSLGELIGLLQDKAVDSEAPVWKVAFHHFVSSILNFGFRVYSQQLAVSKRGGLAWAECHAAVIDALLAEDLNVDIDERGRLIVVDGSPASLPIDQDGDSLAETIVLSRKDAALVVRGEASSIYAAMRERIGDWSLSPTTQPAKDPGSVPPTDSETSSPASTVRAVADEDSGAISKAQVEEVAQPVSHDTRAQPLVTAPANASEPSKGGPTLGEGVAQDGVRLIVGPTIDTFQSQLRVLDISDTSLNQLNMGVVGDLGTGKTQLLKSLIYQISRAKEANQGVQPRFLIFDYKRDYSTAEFVAATGARVIKPKHLPLNPFDLSSAGDSMTPWLDRFKFFSDVLDKIFSGVGPVQRAQLKTAVRSAYDACPTGTAPTIYDIHANYRTIIGNKADSVSAIIDDLVDMELFSPNYGEAKGFGEFLDGVVVIALDALGQDDRTKNMLVAIMLNMFYEYMLRIPKRPYRGAGGKLRTIDSFLLVDEADNIMRYEFDVLRKVLLQGREFGVGVILASQYLSHFKVGPTDYREPLLTWFIHKVPSVQPQELGALGLRGPVASFADRIRSLEVHQCLFKTSGGVEDIVRGIPFFEMQAELKKGS
ncbi:MAG: ATP-binding protein [Burkholderiales bacterium]